MQWWEQPLSAAPALGLGRRLDSGQGSRQGSRPEVSVEGQIIPLSQDSQSLHQHEKCLHPTLPGQVATQAP